MHKKSIDILLVEDDIGDARLVQLALKELSAVLGYCFAESVTSIFSTVIGRAYLVRRRMFSLSTVALRCAVRV